MIGMGARNFKRRFKKATGDTPQQYLQRLRIEEAKRKLETTKESMDDITYQVGYEDSSSFRRLSKKTHGALPGGVSRDIFQDGGV
jgi:transcriptional regulator GlxA family with amidase domain